MGRQKKDMLCRQSIIQVRLYILLLRIRWQCRTHQSAEPPDQERRAPQLVAEDGRGHVHHAIDLQAPNIDQHASCDWVGLEV